MFVTMTLLVGSVILAAQGDPLALARLGTRYTEGDPQGSPGYDGQFVYYMASELRPAVVASKLDVPAYRYQRILLPVISRIMALGQTAAIPWTISLSGIMAQVLGTWAVAELLAMWKVNRWYALVYGLWAGFSLAVRLDLPEPLAYALATGGMLATLRGKEKIGWVLFGLALFAKEVVGLVVAGQFLALLVERRWKAVWGMSLVTLLPYALFQAWLWYVFGEPGIGSGGAMATPFEVVPFLGLFKIGMYSPPYLGAMLLVFGPAVVLPAVWGVVRCARLWLSGERNVVVLVALFNCLIIPFIPFSTFRETGGLIRFICGMVLGILLLAARYKMRRVLNYSWLWLILNLFLIK